MKSHTIKITLFMLAGSITLHAQQADNYLEVNHNQLWVYLLIVLCITLIGLAYYSIKRFVKTATDEKKKLNPDNIIDHLNSQQIEDILKRKTKGTSEGKKGLSVLTGFMLLSCFANAQSATAGSVNLMAQPGIVITILLISLPLLMAVILAVNKANRAIRKYDKIRTDNEEQELVEALHETNSNLDAQMQMRKQALDYALTDNELAGNETAEDNKGIIKNVSDKHEVHFTALKKKAMPRPTLDPSITKLVLWYLGCAAFWLVIGTGVGQYVGIKFIVPEIDNFSWLSFGRLRPVHTNMVFWGWASLGILGLGHYVVPMVSNTKLYSIKWGWIALILTNLQVIIGTISLMAGINNGGGEFREYIWPIMALFAVALILTLINFLKTVANRTTKEIYISNWYIVSAIIFTIIVASTAYLPFWQNGLGETIVQGYYMHSGVGMWFTLFTLGLLYYFIPQQINQPIYAYSLGILAFWTQIIFYTIIGTHHFVFSAIPWWLQTVAIVGSAGMIIPVCAATINYFMTFKGQWDKVSNSYTLPFFLTAVVYYFIVSMQGTVEAFRFTNLLWHFTDFTVAHSHLGFYGIITFAIWGGAYAIVPRLTGKEPPQHLVGTHFWLAFIGLLFYAIPLMWGATIKGLMWQSGQPFIDSVVMMFEFWVWRAVGGSMMFVSHILFAYNFYKMARTTQLQNDVSNPLESITKNQFVTK